VTGSLVEINPLTRWVYVRYLKCCDIANFHMKGPYTCVNGGVTFRYSRGDDQVLKYAYMFLSSMYD
jgi:hypothetical protein